MNDDKMAKDYNIEGGSVLHLVLALRGGGGGGSSGGRGSSAGGAAPCCCTFPRQPLWLLLLLVLSFPLLLANVKTNMGRVLSRALAAAAWRPSLTTDPIGSANSNSVSLCCPFVYQHVMADGDAPPAQDVQQQGELEAQQQQQQQAQPPQRRYGRYGRYGRREEEEAAKTMEEGEDECVPLPAGACSVLGRCIELHPCVGWTLQSGLCKEHRRRRAATAAAAAPPNLLPVLTALPRLPSCSYEEYVPLKKRRQMEEAERLARLGRAPQQQATSADTGGRSGGRSGGEDSDGEVVDRHGRQRESLLVMKAKQLQEVGASPSQSPSGTPAPAGADSRQPAGCECGTPSHARCCLADTHLCSPLPHCSSSPAERARDGAGKAAEGGGRHHAARHPKGGAQDLRRAGQGHFVHAEHRDRLEGAAQVPADERRGAPGGGGPGGGRGGGLPAVQGT